MGAVNRRSVMQEGMQFSGLKIPASKGVVRMKRNIVDRSRAETTQPRWSAVFGCDEIDETLVKKPRDSV